MGSVSTPDAVQYRIVICHPELLLGQAVAAALTDARLGAEPLVVTSSEQLLAQAGTGFDLALVADMIGDELSELLEALAFRGSNLPVLVLCGPRDFRAAAQTLEWGAVGSVSSASSIDDLSRAIIAACEGNVVFLDDAPDHVRQALEDRQTERSAADALYRSLSDRERTIVAHLAGGRATGEIARELALSPHTIRTAIRNLGDKLNAQGQLRIALASRDLLHAISPPSPGFVRRERALQGESRAC